MPMPIQKKRISAFTSLGASHANPFLWQFCTIRRILPLPAQSQSGRV
jgi:hypothetical protein